jgi:cyclic beta-1,2-glucan synthetase
MRSFFQFNNLKLSYQNEEPLRAELFSSDQMDRFGKALASSHKLSTKPSKDHLLRRLADNELHLQEVRKLLTDSIKRKYQIRPAGEWLIDNFYLLEENIRVAKTHFPKNYSEALPQLIDSSSKVLTRVYDIVLQIISHSDGRIDIASLSSFIKAYQSVTHLLLGELWAIPIMLRLALIENIRRVSSRIALDRIDGNLADYWAAEMIETAEKDPKNLLLVIADMARSNPPLVSAFVSELIRQLRGKGPALGLSLSWIELQLSETGITSTEMVNAEIQKQAADQVSISNSFGSLRLLEALDWTEFVEQQSIVEQTLRSDKNGIYGSMDFPTRDQYRHIVERIAKKTEKSEFEVAQIAINLAKESAPDAETDESVSHVGYYLIDQGLEQTKKLASMQETMAEKVRVKCARHAFSIYASLIALITLTISLILFRYARKETDSYSLLTVMVVLFLFCASQLAITVVNFISTLLVKPRLLAKMNFQKLIPSECRTLVVVPVMLASTEEIETLVDSLEVRYLANRNDHLHFGLLTDFVDAETQILPEDDVLLNLAKLRIEQLNTKYRKQKNDLFFLFHRPRHWNAKENAWIGYERKRGKLSELNALLRGKGEDRFSLLVGDQSLYSSIKYVITLDADTQLPLGSACKLIGTIAHPLNRAWYNEKKKRVTKGYGILQPRVTVSLPDASSSLYTKMHGNEPGIDPYTRASSDVYQDLFGEGSFIGKGIYEVDMFNKTLDGRFSENGILSHDLLEGCYLRSGLISDVQLFEGYPSSYRADMKRGARWIRGDWQIFSWFLPIVPGSNNRWFKNPISGLSRWKIFDNIRRSLVPAALTLLLILGWTLLPSSLFWTIAVSATIVTPIIISAAWSALSKPKDVVLTYHIENSVKTTVEIIKATLFTLICLPYQAYSNSKAMVRTIWRMLVSKRKLLEWNPTSDHKGAAQSTLFQSYSMMWIQVLLALVVCVILASTHPGRIGIAAPILALWLLAPLVTWWASLPLQQQESILSNEQHIFLQKLARKTWSFFERFVTAEDNWLPPDNFQEQPTALLAHRTSPTNIGLALVANLSAWQFGYLTTSQLVERTSHMISTMKKMERYKGHFYNWYDTQSLIPLSPRYVSTVDSGNLAGHLMVLRQGLLAIPLQDLLNLKLFEGLRDTVRVLSDMVESKDKKTLDAFILELESACDSPAITHHELRRFAESLSKSLALVVDQLTISPDQESYWWKQLLVNQLSKVNEAFSLYKPWFLLLTAPAGFIDLVAIAPGTSLIELQKSLAVLDAQLNHRKPANYAASDLEWLDALSASIAAAVGLVREQIALAEDLAEQCNELTDIEWDFLLDTSSNLFTIGYNVKEHNCDPSYYDLLASESRLGTFVGIAMAKLPEKSWFALGRLLTNVDRHPILLSWSGSMFEYLMPMLVMPTFENTLLDQTCRGAVDWQIKYGKKMGLPWGISESGYNAINSNMNYQYRAFGAPGLGLKRGLEEDLVIAPYATALALMVAPERACENLEDLDAKGFQGRYGFYEAIDYTPSRVPRGEDHAIIFQFMAHHQAMSLLSLAYLLLDKPMQKLFMAEPQFKATLLILQERIPRATTFFAHTTDIADINYVASGAEVRILNTPQTTLPEVQLLSNGKYQVMVSNAGSGYSRWKGISVTRWREDATRDNWGAFCYIRDLETGNYWSNTHQPTLKTVDKYEVAFSQGRIDFSSSNKGIDTKTEIVVSAEDDIEMRRIRITNSSTQVRSIEVTSYAEVVIAPGSSDLMQPAFSNLFVQTEIIPLQHAILCTRRPRSAGEHAPWMFHLMSLEGKDPEEVSYETDRMAFLGRGNTAVNPSAMTQLGPLGGGQGSVLDPIVAIRYKIRIAPEEVITLDSIIGIGETKEICLGLIDKYQDTHHKDRVFKLALTHSQVLLRQINASEADAQLYGRLAGAILFPNAAFRADPSILINNHRQQSGLWSYSISGDLPIVLLKMEKRANLPLAIQLVQAHAYWRQKGLAVDLVIWNEEHNGYRQELQNEIQSLVPAELIDRPGGIFLRASDQISNEDRTLIQTVARIIIADNGGTLEDHLNRKQIARSPIPYLIPAQKYKPSVDALLQPNDLLFQNGMGGFSANGSEYIIHLGRKNRTPLPWVNVIANPNFGTVVSESGSAYTWTENAHELRLTPWNNDPVSDIGGEYFYIRDEETGHFWSPTLLPAGGKSAYLTRHGFGYSVFEHLEDGIYSEMTVYVDNEAAVKYTAIRMINRSGRNRKLSVTGYTEWVLGDHRMKTSMYIHTEVDAPSGVLLAKNPYNTEFSNRVAFFDTDSSKRTITGDRAEFIGRNGTLQKPDAMLRTKLSGRIGLALDPCAAIQVPVELTVEEERNIVFRLGAGKDLAEASAIARLSRGPENAHVALDKVKDKWKHVIGTMRVLTPDPAINIISNGWLTYQTLSSRLWGRSGFYQSGGAFGFRDQLQDVLSLLFAAPELARSQILLCASRQFKEGDVQHWWHPPTGNGVRTKCSDDFLWLPYVTARYITHTGDMGVLDQLTPYLEGRMLNADEESYYDLPIVSQSTANLYIHCVQAIKYGFRFGEHGLPLIGTGDWNDGFDKVGNKGKGESVWMAFFLYGILREFSTIASLCKDPAFADECTRQAKRLKENISKHAWDGHWYKRAWFDDGTPLGSSADEECKIDSIAQSWSVLSGAGDGELVQEAMKQSHKLLVKKEIGIIQLLEPAFDKSALNPGYIKGYVPGIRENGGQYTHAAIWLIMAFAKLGDSKRVWDLLNMVNPINHANSPETIATYKAEPYVVAADVYSFAPHGGRGGWTWYTGSAGWMYSLIIESFLGLRKVGNKLTCNPCVPEHWQSFNVDYRYLNATYHIAIRSNHELKQIRILVDDLIQTDQQIILVNDGIDHYVQIDYPLIETNVIESSSVAIAPS